MSPTTATEAVLRDRAWAALLRAKKPLTAPQLGKAAHVTDGGALTFLHHWTAAGRLVAVPGTEHLAPFLTRYATPAIAATLTPDDRSTTVTRTAPDPSPPANPTPSTPVDKGTYPPASATSSSSPGRPTTPHPSGRLTSEKTTDSPAHHRAVGDPSAAAGPVDKGTYRRPTSVDALRAAALDYAGRGWHVFPLVPNEKRPAVKDWEARATTDPDRIRRCWSATAPAAGAYGIGIACGPSGLVVIDLDTPKPNRRGALPTPPPDWDAPGIIDGVDVFAMLCHTGRHPFPMGDTYTVHTGRGGLHLYFTHPTTGPHLRNTQGDLGWLIDTRAHGGYVVAPPTTVNGRPYDCPDPDAAAVPLLGWLAETLTPAPIPAQRPVSVALNPVTGAGADARRDAYLAAAVDRQIESVLTAGEGRRNRSLYLSAVALGQLIASGELNGPAITARLESAAHTAGLGEIEISRTITSGLRAGTKRPRTLAARTGVAA